MLRVNNQMLKARDYLEVHPTSFHPNIMATMVVVDHYLMTKKIGLQPEEIIEFK